MARFLDILKSAEPGLEFRWDARDAVSIKVPGIGVSWCRLRTKDPAALDARFVGKAGQFNLSRLEGIGNSSTLTPERAAGGDVMRIYFKKEDELQAGKLKSLLAEHLRGFREAFRGREEEMSEAG